MEALYERIFSIQTSSDFEQVALDIFDHQFKHCTVYRDYVNGLNRTKPQALSEIPFLPISFFKTHPVIEDNAATAITFKSSGTGGERSVHHLVNAALYERSFNACYDRFIGNPEEQVILALLPNYLEQGESSLVYMVDHLIRRSNNDLSMFCLNNHDELISAYNQALELGKSVVIFGVAYALLDLAEQGPDLSKARIIETGGMKGRRTEITKAELHTSLSEGFNGAKISSEYGMTELLSQAYSDHQQRFVCPSTMQVLIREVNDPFSYVNPGKTGGINIIDLANIHSCSFIETQDLGRQHPDGFEIMGRFDHSDIRGCNLLVQ